MTNNELISLAIKARENANVQISGFKVGAALLSKDGKVISGCNIEDPSGIGITNVCAERCAFIKAISEGITEFSKIAVVGGPKSQDENDRNEKTNGNDSINELIFCSPCGACRQYINSWSPDIKVIIREENGEIKEYDMNQLLPYSFNEKF